MTRSTIAACWLWSSGTRGVLAQVREMAIPPLADLERGDFLWLSKFEGPEDSLGPLYGPVLKRLRRRQGPDLGTSRGPSRSSNPRHR